MDGTFSVQFNVNDDHNNFDGLSDLNKVEDDYVPPIVYRQYTKDRICCGWKQQLPTAFWICAVVLSFINISVGIIYLYDNNVTLGGGTIQQWVVILDVAALLLFVLWLAILVSDAILSIMLECFSHPYFRYLSISWNSYRIVAVGFLWGMSCGLSWKLFHENNTSVPVSDQMLTVMHDLTIGTVLLFSLLGTKIYILGVYEGHLHKGMRSRIGVSMTQEENLIKIEKMLFQKKEKRLLALKYKQLELEFYTSQSLFRSTKRFDELHTKTHVPIDSTIAIFADRLTHTGDQEDGLLRERDFFKFNCGPAKAKLLFSFLDTDKDGRVSSLDIILALRAVLRERKNLLLVMRSKRVLLEITNTLVNVFLWALSAIVIVVFVFEIDLADYATSFATLALAFSFAYQNMLQDILDSLYMLFFVYPFNIGDLVEIEGNKYYIEDVGLLSCTCRSEDGQTSFIRTSMMKNPVQNLNRGKWVRLKISCRLLPDTTLEQIEIFKQNFGAYCANTQLFSSKISVYADTSLNPGPTLIVRLKLKGYATWQDKKKWKKAQTSAIMGMTQISNELKILDRTFRFDLIK